MFSALSGPSKATVSEGSPALTAALDKEGLARRRCDILEVSGELQTTAKGCWDCEAERQ